MSDTGKGKIKVRTKLVHETILQSLIKDLSTLAFLCISVWFNQKYCGGSYFLNGVILVIFLAFIASSSDAEQIYSKEIVEELKNEK